MPGLELLIPFATATLLFAVMPGPAILYTAAQTMAGGRRAGFQAAIGIHVGGLLHVTAAAAGLSAVFRYVPEAYMAVKILGALYLIWLGIGIIRQRLDTSNLPHVAARSPRRAFFSSVLVEVLNPKAALFFLAFLPQFVDPAGALPVWSQLLILGIIVNLSFTVGDVLTVFLTSAVLARVRRSGFFQRALRYVGGSILIGLGAHLATSKSQP